MDKAIPDEITKLRSRWNFITSFHCITHVALRLIGRRLGLGLQVTGHQHERPFRKPGKLLDVPQIRCSSGESRAVLGLSRGMLIAYANDGRRRPLRLCMMIERVAVTALHLGQLLFKIIVGWSSRFGRIAMFGALTLCFVAGDLGHVSAMAGNGDYTAAQAGQGAAVYSQHCANCHGVSLEGKGGPALTGTSFQSMLEFAKMTASQLYEVISHTMPVYSPGSLSSEQYTQVLSFILSKNGYPSGAAPLSKERLGQIKLLPFPGAASSTKAR
jgi:mono/diheme cytochrome c family protein